MKNPRNRLVGFLFILCALCITYVMGNSQTVQAATKATYTIRKIQEKKTYKDSSATYSYELPQLKGNSAAVKKINQSLKASYTNNLSLKKSMFKEFDSYKKNGTLNKKSVKLFADTKCTVTYNKNGYIKFAFRFGWHGCASYNFNRTNVIYRLSDGKKVSKIPASAAESKILNQIRGTWYTLEGDKVVFNGKNVDYYYSSSGTEPFWSHEIQEITKTSYGYYIKIELEHNWYYGYRLNLKDTGSLVYIGNGNPGSSAGYSKALCLSRKK